MFFVSVQDNILYMEQSYKATIGLEVHAELKTRSKMFCGCANDPHHADPNTHVCPICLAHPGSLPVPNEEAILFLLQVGTAIGGNLAEFSEFDRKNYFYPDIPKAYQISQYAYPFVSGGELAGVNITRVHLEEDTARSQHDKGKGSIVDFNRAGVPLMELVTEPVIHDPESAGKFARELQLLLRSIGVAEANMEKGEMRVEANISVSKTAEFGTKVEVKNLNSFRSVEGAITYEIERQVALLEKGESVTQETRGWDEINGVTFSQRAKESAEDYRYFPDPDLPKFLRSSNKNYSDSRLAEIIDKTPQKKRYFYEAHGVPKEVAEIIISSVENDTFFRTVLEMLTDRVSPILAANYFVNDVLGVAVNLDQSMKPNPERLAELLDLLSSGAINSRVTKDLLIPVVFEGKDPKKLAEDKGLLQKNSSEELLPIVTAILNNHASVVSELRDGKENALQFLIGQVMKETKGSANPQLVAELIRKQI